MINLEGHFEIPFLKENGFTRRKCEICSGYYWSQDPNRRNCGDSPCQEYTFIDNPPTKRKYELSQMRNIFLKYFEKNDHTIIKPYPVIARWRDDVYLVGASIYNFQPYVTEGRIPPPANPLVISQPCLRFTDIDQVGKTFGRHMIIFEMGGAHAFNRPEKEIYWKEDTIRFHHELLTQELGIVSEEVSYKEDFWSGGGNAGPDLEACVAGLEISTLVFMMYRYIGDKLVEMPFRTVDTGYGMERWAWLSQGSATGFHATYGKLLENMIKLANIEVNNETITSYARIALRSDTQTLPIEKMRIAENLGLRIEELEKTVKDFQRICTTLDHTKALCFILSEGIVPSNMQEGYLARLLIRRTYRMLKTLGIEDRFFDIVDYQIAHWSRDFPNLKFMKDEIIEELDVEQEKYKKTLEKGADLVKRISRQIKTSGEDEIPPTTLLELYDSHGLVPEMVQEFAAKEKVTINIPQDFFGKVAKRHLDTEKINETIYVKISKEKFEKYPETIRLYYQDPYLSEFKARVLDVIDGKYVILNQTAFYSEGGGQLSDIGNLLFDGRKSKVIDVQSIGNIIQHTVEGPSPSIGTEIQGKIDWERRISLMRHHTSTHILIGAAKRVLGEHAWQSGAAKDVESSRLDISHYKHLTRDEINKIEQLACETITNNIPVETFWLSRDEAEKKYGYRLYQGGSVPGTKIRIVRTGDWDVEACGGTHVRSTGEIGIIKILRVERIQDGVERLIFASGTQALKRIQEREQKFSETAQILNTPIENVKHAALTITDELDSSNRKLKRIFEEFTKIEAKSLLEKANTIEDTKLIVIEKKKWDEEEIVMLGGKISNDYPNSISIIILQEKTVRIFVFAGKSAIKSGAHAGKIAKELSAIIGGGGGGKDYFGQGGGTNTEKIREMEQLAPAILKKQLIHR
ncbi:alanine--tRNA ligase [[Eubacterium] cellulosolvens]